VRCFETIKVKDGKIFNLPYHNWRFNKTRKEVFGAKETLFLENFISPPPQGLFRCKVFYKEEVEEIKFFPYTPKNFKTFKLLFANIEYPYKFEDRNGLNRLLTQEADDVLIIKNDLLTDTSIANVAFFYKNEWITPLYPLLKGTTRERLLQEGFLKVANIEVVDLPKFEKMAIMNAMLGFYPLKEVIFLKGE